MTELGSRLKLDCLLKEAELLQSEMDTRIARQAQSLYICISLLAAVIGGTATASAIAFSSQPNIDKKLVTGLICFPLIFLPWLIAPLAAMFFDDEMAMGGTDHRRHSHLAHAIRNLLRTLDCEADDVFTCTLQTRLKDNREICHQGHRWWALRPRTAANVRLLMFVVPFVIAFASAIYFFGHSASEIRSFFWSLAWLGCIGDLILLVLLSIVLLDCLKVWKRVVG